MSLFCYIALTRGIIFLWIGATAFSISQLYSDGYKSVKRESGLITALIRILFWLSIVFVHLSLASFAYAFESHTHKYILAAMPITMLPVGILLDNFRKESIKRQDL